MNYLPIYSNELNECESETDVFYGRSEMEKYRFFIFFNSMTDDKYPYMRVTDGNHLSYTKSCRISLIEPKYIEVSDDPLDTWRFNDIEKKEFIEMMNSLAHKLIKSVSICINEKYTFWDYLLKEYDFQVDNREDKCLFGSQMPDYNLL